MTKENKKQEVKQEFTLLSDGRIEHKYIIPESEYNKEGFGVIGKLQNISIAYIDSKEKAVEVLEYDIKSTEETLVSLEKQNSLMMKDW